MLDSGRGRLLSLRELVALILLALPILVTVALIEDVRWVRGLPPLKILVPVSLVVWAYLARSRLPGRIGHPLAILGGLLAAFIIGAVTLSGGVGFGELANNLFSWFGAIGSKEGDRGASMVGVGLIAVTFWMGHVSVWLAYRRSQSVLASLPALTVMMVVLTFLNSDFYWYFFMYLLAAAPGIAYRYAGLWRTGLRRAPVFGSVVVGVVLMALPLALVSSAPTPEGTVIPLASQFEERWYSFREQWSNLFYGVPNRKQWPVFSPPQDLPMVGPFPPEGDALFLVESEDPYRWRMRVYETYTGNGWVGHEDSFSKTEPVDLSEEFSETLKERETVSIGVRIFAKSNSLVSAGEPINASIPARVEVSPEPVFKLYLADSQSSYLPSEVQENRDGLVSFSNLAKVVLSKTGAAGESGADGALSQAPIVNPTSLGFNLAIPRLRSSASDSQQGGGSQDEPYVLIERIAPGPRLPIALLGDRTLVPPRQYTSVGSVSTASFSMLRAAGEHYPQWVTDRYLQLPNDFPDSVKDLARELTAGDDNAHDMAQSIRRYLITLPYSLEIMAPPAGQDWVEFFLFEQRRGYCQNYATAMITMLRSLGVPARLVIGFAPSWDDDRGAWLVQGQQYHAWPEVYFPEYGWVEFEPTPARVQPGLLFLNQPPGGPVITATVGSDCSPEDELLGICGDDGLLDLSLLDFDGDLLAATEEGSIDEEASSWFGLGGLFSSIWALIALGVVMAVVVPAGTLSYVGRRYARLGYPTLAFASMSLMGRLAGVGRLPQETPWEYGHRIGQSLPDRADDVAQITRGFVAVRYGPSKELKPQETNKIRVAWVAVRPVLRGRILRRLVPRLRRRS